MRNRAFALFASIITMAAAPAFAQEANGPSFEVGGGVASGFLYPDQATVFSERTTMMFDATVCSDGWCGTIWTAQTGESETSETDLIVSREFDTGPVTIGLEGGYYLVAGEDIWSGIASATLPVSDSLSVTASYEVMGGGYETTVTKLAGNYEHSFTDRVSGDIEVAISHDTSIDTEVLSYEAGVSYALTEQLAVRGYLQGFESPVGDGYIVGVDVRRNW